MCSPYLRDTALCIIEIHRVKLKTWRRGTNKRPVTGIPGKAPGQRWLWSWQLPSVTRKLQNILMSSAAWQWQLLSVTMKLHHVLMLSAAWQWQPPSDCLEGWAAYHHHFPAVHLPLRTRNSHYYYWSLLYSAILRSRADSLRSRVILRWWCGASCPRMSVWHIMWFYMSD